MPKGYVQKCPQCARVHAQLTWTPLLECFVNELIFANRPLPPAAMLPFDGAICVNLLQQFKCSRLVGKFLDKFLAPYPFSYLSTLIKTWLFAENTMCIVYMISSKHATECLQYAVLETEIFYHRYLKTDYSAILCAYFTWESCALIWIGCVQISHFCGTYTQIFELCWVYFFRTWCIYNTVLC